MITFYEPTLAVKLEMVYGFDSDESAYFYTFETLFAFLATVFFTIRPLNSHTHIWTGVGLAGSAISVFLMGPSSLFHLP